MIKYLIDIRKMQYYSPLQFHGPFPPVGKLMVSSKSNLSSFLRNKIPSVMAVHNPLWITDSGR